MGFAGTWAIIQQMKPNTGRGMAKFRLNPSDQF
jgi:hypothetical protein